MKKISIRLSEVTLKTLLERYNTNSITTAIRSCLDDAINTQLLAGGKKRRRLTPSQTLDIVKKEKHTSTIPYSVYIDADITTHLKDYYGTNCISEAIRCAIYDVLNNTGKELCIKPNLVIKDTCLCNLYGSIHLVHRTIHTTSIGIRNIQNTWHDKLEERRILIIVEEEIILHLVAECDAERLARRDETLLLEVVHHQIYCAHNI